MEKETANSRPSLLRSASISAYAAAEPGREKNANRDPTNLDPFFHVENPPASHVDHGHYNTAHEHIAPLGNYAHADPWTAVYSGNHAITSFAYAFPPLPAEDTFAAGAADNAGIALSTQRPHYNWTPALAGGIMDPSTGSNIYHPDPSFPMMGSVTNGNVYGCQWPTNGFGVHPIAATAFPNAFNAIDSSNDYGGQWPVDSVVTQPSLAAAFPNPVPATDSVDVHGGPWPTNGIVTHASAAATAIPATASTAATPISTAQSGQKQYICNQCNTSFRRRPDLKRHTKIHEPGSKIFKCGAEGCGYGSYRKDKLGEHVRRVGH